MLSNKTQGKEEEARISELWHLSFQAAVTHAEAFVRK